MWRAWAGVAILAVVAGTIPAGDQPNQPARSPDSNGTTLKVVTFNVQYLPGPGRLFNKRANAEYRARTLAARLAEGYDVIGLNEVFDAGPRELLLGGLRERLGGQFHVVTAPKTLRSEYGVDGGLALVTRLPILSSHCIRYGNDSPVAKYGPMADGFAAKGAIHARLGRGEKAGDSFDVFITHLESTSASARTAQYPLLAKFIREHASRERPALIMGDFNTDGRPNAPDHPSYVRLMQALRDGRPHCPLQDLWPTLASGPGGTSDPDRDDGGERIDYIFVSNPTPGTVRLKPVSVRVNRFLDEKVVSLSDHAAVEATLRWDR